MTSTKPTTHYSITAAHRITGKSRTTIQKHVKQGKLAYEIGERGVKLIDASELIRVYGDTCDFERGQLADRQPADTPSDHASVHAELSGARQALEMLREERERERRQLQERIDYLQEMARLAQEGHNRATLLLESRPATPPIDSGAGYRDAELPSKRQASGASSWWLPFWLRD